MKSAFGKLRLLAGIVASAGVAFCVLHPIRTTLEVGGASLPIPWDVMLILVGVVGYFFPTAMPLGLALLPIGASAKDRLKNFVEGIEESRRSRYSGSDDGRIAEIVKSHIRKSKVLDATFVTVLGAMAVIIVILMHEVGAVRAESDLRRARERLHGVVQEFSLKYSSRDAFRRAAVDRSITRYEDSIPALCLLHQGVARLADSPSQTAFDEAVKSLYAENVQGLENVADIKAHLQLSFDDEPSRLDAVSVCTLYAMLCHSVGDQGAKLMPYVLARRLCKIGCECGLSGRVCPATHSAVGVSAAHLLRCYEEYSRHVPEAESYLTLAREAARGYRAVSEATPTLFNRARIGNNNTDLTLTLIRDVYPPSARPYAQPRGQEELAFLHSRIGFTDSRRIPVILQAMCDELTDAIELHQNPAIYFTRAQLYAVAAQISPKDPVPAGAWTDRDELLHKALDDLEVARTLQLPIRYFKPKRASEFYLDPLWAAPYEARMRKIAEEPK